MSIDNIVDFEIVFMNCDSVMIDPAAVVSMSFEVESEKYEWNPKNQRIDYERNLKSFKMTLDLNRSQLFRRRYITGMFGEGVDSRNADGVAAIERLKSSSDITAIYIQGTKYSMPIKWKVDGGSEINLLQTTSVLTTTGGCYQLNIDIIPESEYGKICVY
jgi:hypothetical protein